MTKFSQISGLFKEKENCKFLSLQVTYSKTLWQNFTKTLFKKPHFGFIGGLYYSFQHNNFLENLPQTLFFPFLDLSLCKMEEKKKLAARFCEKLTSDVQLYVWTDIQTKKHKLTGTPLPGVKNKNIFSWNSYIEAPIKNLSKNGHNLKDNKVIPKNRLSEPI